MLPDTDVMSAGSAPDDTVFIKAYLCGEPPEVRRFHLASHVSSDYQYLWEKLHSIFPQLKDKSFTVAWTDREGDEVVMSSDEELKDALVETLQFMKNQLFKVTVRTYDSNNNVRKDNTMDESRLHPGVVCDGCQSPVRGFRYKCLQCVDYDLCSKCETKGFHCGHSMMRLVEPVSAGPPWRRFMRQCNYMFPIFNEGPGCALNAGMRGRGRGRRGRRKPQGAFPPENRSLPAYRDAFIDAVPSGSSSPQQIPQSKTTETSQHPYDYEYLKRMLTNFWVDMSGGESETNYQKQQTVISETQLPKDTTSQQAEHSTKNNHSKQAEVTGERNTIRNKEECLIADDAGTEFSSIEVIQDPEDMSPYTGRSKSSSPTNKHASAEFVMVHHMPSAYRKENVASPLKLDHQVSTGEELGAKPKKRYYEEINNNTIATTPPPCYNLEEEHADPVIRKSLQQMMGMGFSNDGGWLTQLLVNKKGDISQALDVLLPVKWNRSQS